MSSVHDRQMNRVVRFRIASPTPTCSLIASDIESTHAELSARGVKFPLPPARQHFGWWALFEDNEGTRYALGQWPMSS